MAVSQERAVKSDHPDRQYSRHRRLTIGLGLPQLLQPEDLSRFAARAEELGFDDLFVGDHVVLPADGTTQYPYTPGGAFSRPSTLPFHEAMVLLGYLAASTQKIQLGTSVLILPYRNPIVQAKMFASLDILTGGRIICGVGVGWLKEEFETLGVDYHSRGQLTDEFLEILHVLWKAGVPEYRGHSFQFSNIEFAPKPLRGTIPIWVGGHTHSAIRRAARYGDCWHPARQTPDFVAKSLPLLLREKGKAGREHHPLSISLKRSVHFTDLGISERDWVRSNASVIGTTDEIVADAERCWEIGIDQLTYDFRVEGLEALLEVMERLASSILPLRRVLT